MPNADPIVPPGAPSSVAGLILAAGSSTRMGRNKMLLDLDGRSVVRRTVEAALAAGLDRVVVVLGHEADRVRGSLDGLEGAAGVSCELIVNADHAKGVGTSLHAGLRHVAPSADAAVVILADMPFVTSSMIAGVVRLHRETGARLVLSHYGDVQAPPTLYARSLFADVLAVPDEKCGKQVAKRYRDEAAIASWPSSALRDIDVTDDYEAVRAELAPRAGRDPVVRSRS
jgi:molybdenum cofactor cytidylyltransferase